MRIAIATPIQNRVVGCAHHESMWPLLRDHRFSILPSKITVDDDLVRARSRCVRVALEETRADALLFADSDVVVSTDALAGMIAADVDAIGCTYPKKHLDDWGVARDFAIRTREAPIVDGKASVDAIGLGFMLLRRPLLQKLTEEYADELTDYSDGIPTVMLFMLAWEEKNGRRVLLPEDYSFCRRVRKLTDLWLYCGEGSPLAHEGHHVFRGRAEDVHPLPQPIQAPFYQPGYDDAADERADDEPAVP